MAYQKIETIFHKHAHPERGIKMAAYLKNQFPCLGISSPIRKEISKEFLKEKVKSKAVDWEFVYWCFEKEEREMQYLAIDYLRKVHKFLNKKDIEILEQLILSKSWWDSVDGLNHTVGYLCQQFPELKEEKITPWVDHENRWLIRVSIIFQLTYKEKTDAEFLAKAILANADSKEFFVNKAIGWALRQYSKFNPEWVKAFLAENALHALSVREASKYL